MNVIMLLKPKDTVAYLYGKYTLRQGLEKMRMHGYTAIPVISDDGMYTGSVSEGDFLWHIVESCKSGELKALEKCTIADILRPGWNPSVWVDVTMDELLERVTNQNFVPVTDDRGVFVGIVTRKDVIQYFMHNQPAAPAAQGQA
jgi:CBS-domain-containing membrane protein